MPYFVIPECNITLLSVYTYIKNHPDGSFDLDEACYTLGSYDKRTVYKHITFGWSIINKTIANLLVFISFSTRTKDIPIKSPGVTLIVYLEKVTALAHEEVVRLYGAHITKPATILYVHMVLWFEKSRNQPQTALNRVLWNLHFYDTS